MDNIGWLMGRKKPYIRSVIFIFLLLYLCLAAIRSARTDTQVRVLIYGCDGASKTEDILASLERCNRERLIPGYEFKVTGGWFDSNHKLDAAELKKHDVLVVPGGYLHKFPRYWVADDVRGWVREGGGYVGICGGEILAIEGKVEGSFFGSFEGLEIAPHVCRINPRWVGERNIRMTWAGTSLLGLSGDQRVLHWNGSIMDYRKLPPFGEKVFALYTGNGLDLEEPDQGNDIWNPDWDGAAAIIGDLYGKGRLILSGPHPEFPSKEGKFQKPRLIGAMVKWAYRDDSFIPFVIGREDRLPNSLMTTSLAAMSALVTASSEISSMKIYIRRGTARGILGVYSDDGGRPKTLLAQSEPFPVSRKAGWHEVRLKRPIEVDSGSILWLAWLFDGSVVLSSDGTEHAGDLGGSRIAASSFCWTGLKNSSLPRLFPLNSSFSHEIVALNAKGELSR
jgi:glutamine amidotransferase-like uncharacterized protein